MTPGERKAALELEFERLKQRQDYLDRMLQGHSDTWAGIQNLVPDGVELVIDKMVTEARQGALAMATVAKTLAQLGENAPAAEEVDPLQKIQDELAAKRLSKAQ